MSESRIHTVKVPNPFVEGRNCVYIIADDPVTMIDSGVATDRAYQELLSGLEEHGLKPDDIRRIIPTHKHIDHIGNAWRFQQRWGAEVMIHELELNSVTDVDPSGKLHASVVGRRLDEWNVPETARPSATEASRPRWEIESVDATPLVDGQRLPLGDGYIEVLHTPGHTIGSICLRFDRFLFSGDHVLPDISPNVGGGDIRSRDLLRRYLTSLRSTSEISRDNGLQVLPGHGNPLSSAATRCDELIRHHEQRLDEFVEILRRHGEQTVYELARRLFGEMRDFHVVLGCAEANAHLEFLIDQGRVSSSRGRYESI